MSQRQSLKTTEITTQPQTIGTSPTGGQIFVEHWGGEFAILAQFFPIFNIGGMNLDHDLFQVSKLSENQKKKVFTKNGTLFSLRTQVKTKKKGLHQKWNTFTPNSGEDQTNRSSSKISPI